MVYLLHALDVDCDIRFEKVRLLYMERNHRQFVSLFILLLVQFRSIRFSSVQFGAIAHVKWYFVRRAHGH